MARTEHRVADRVLWSLFVVWLVGTPVTFVVALSSLSLFYAATPEQLRTHTLWLVGTLVCGAVVPMAGVLIGALVGRFRAATAAALPAVVAIALLATPTGTGVLRTMRDVLAPAPTIPRGPVICQESSGSDNRCGP